MTSKQRVFSNSKRDLNYTDYIKNKNSIEIFKNIKNTQYQNNSNPNNFIIKKFSSHGDLINFSKTYYNYAGLNNYSLKATKDLYNANNSVKIENDLLLDKQGNGCRNSIYYDECLQLSKLILYPESYYISNDLPGTYLHFNLDLNKWCVNKTLLDYTKVYGLGSKLDNINIDGFNGCTNDSECYNVLQSISEDDSNSNVAKDSKDSKDCCGKKCKTGMCKNAKPLFI
jgi:hypothetical protein